MNILLPLLIAVAVITLVGHSIWVICALVLRGLFGSPSRPPLQTGDALSEARFCPACRNRMAPGARHCLGCGLEVTSAAARELAEFAVVLRQLDAFIARQELEPGTVEAVRQSIIARRKVLL